jgi:hypothetical protein
VSNSFFEAFCFQENLVKQNQSKFEYFTDKVEVELSHLFEEGALPQSAWDIVAPEVEHQQLISSEEGVKLDEHFSILDPDSANLSASNQNTLPISSSSVTLSNLVSDDKFREMVASLNREQRQVFQLILDWCRQSVRSKVDPFYLFCTGGAGVGKSHLINTIVQLANRVLLRRPVDDPEQTVVHLTAPTGTAAYNISGSTLHNSFILPLGQFDMHTKLSAQKLDTLKKKFAKLKILIIDEVSMVGSNLLATIHDRLQAITQLPHSVPFGGVSIIALGDLQQLPPVCEPPIFKQPRNDYYALADLWNSNFSIFELTEIMRQKGDCQFAEILSRVRVGLHTESDISVLQSRAICTDNDETINYTHLFATNREVDSFNDDCLDTINSVAVVIDAVDRIPDNYPGLSIPADERFSGGLARQLTLKVGCRVMLTRNIDVEHGLVNGAQGIVTGFVNSGHIQSTPPAILVLFDTSTERNRKRRELIRSDPDKRADYKNTQKLNLSIYRVHIVPY